MKPYLNIFLNTREVILDILKGEVTYNYKIPFFFIILSILIPHFQFPEFVDSAEIWVTIITSTVIGLVVYFLLVKFFPWWLLLVGKIWKGGAGFKEMQLVFSLSQIPTILLIISQLVNLAIGNITATEEVNVLLQVVVWVFYMKILITGISIVEGYSYMISLLHFVVSVLPFFFIRLMLAL